MTNLKQVVGYSAMGKLGTGPITTGYSSNRLHPDADNPREAAFAAAWHKVNSRDGSTPTVYHLLPQRHSDAEQVAAATVMQWLGSNCGMGFLDDVIQSCPEVRKFLEHSCLSAKAAEARSTPEERARSFDMDQALKPSPKPWSDPGHGAVITTNAPDDQVWVIAAQALEEDEGLL